MHQNLVKSKIAKNRRASWTIVRYSLSYEVWEWFDPQDGAEQKELIMEFPHDGTIPDRRAALHMAVGCLNSCKEMFDRDGESIYDLLEA